MSIWQVDYTWLLMMIQSPPNKPDIHLWWPAMKMSSQKTRLLKSCRKMGSNIWDRLSPAIAPATQRITQTSCLSWLAGINLTMPQGSSLKTSQATGILGTEESTLMCGLKSTFSASISKTTPSISTPSSSKMKSTTSLRHLQPLSPEKSKGYSNHNKNEFRLLT